MATIGEIITDMDYMYTNVVTTAKKIEWINAELKKIYRRFPVKVLYTTTTVDEQKLYTLPDYIKVEDIIPPLLVETTTSGTYDKYTFATLEDELYSDLGENLSGHKYYDARVNGANQIGIYPEPDDAYTMKILAYKTPADLSADDLTAIPDLEPAYHDVLKYKCLELIAQNGNNPDVAMANNFHRNYLEQINAMSRAFMIKKANAPEKRKCNKWW